jgi:hypothetical protein
VFPCFRGSGDHRARCIALTILLFVYTLQLRTKKTPSQAFAWEGVSVKPNLLEETCFHVSEEAAIIVSVALP